MAGVYRVRLFSPITYAMENQNTWVRVPKECKDSVDFHHPSLLKSLGLETTTSVDFIKEARDAPMDGTIVEYHPQWKPSMSPQYACFNCGHVIRELTSLVVHGKRKSTQHTSKQKQTDEGVECPHCRYPRLHKRPERTKQIRRF